MTFALMIVGIVVISVILWKVFSSKAVQEFTEQETQVPTPSSSPIVEEEKEEAPTVESPEEVEKRLKKMKNPDEGKPFAKISTPDVSEVPSEEQAKPKKKKRYYKKRAPKKPGSDNGTV